MEVSTAFVYRRSRPRAPARRSICTLPRKRYGDGSSCCLGKQVVTWRVVDGRAPFRPASACIHGVRRRCRVHQCSIVESNMLHNLVFNFDDSDNLNSVEFQFPPIFVGCSADATGPVRARVTVPYFHMPVDCYCRCYSVRSRTPAVTPTLRHPHTNLLPHPHLQPTLTPAPMCACRQ